MKIKNIKGQSFVEIIFAFGMMALVVAAVVGLSTVSIRNAAYSKNQTQAENLSQQALDFLRSQRDISWASLKSRTNWDTGTEYELYCMNDVVLSLSSFSSGACPSDSFVDTIFKRQVTLTYTEDDSNSTKQFIEVEVEVSWLDAKGTHILSHTTVLTNWN